MSARWILDYVYRSEKFGMVIASFSNITLLSLLAFKASSSYGAYRNLMVAYTIVEIIYSFLSFWTEMAALSTDKAYVVFSYYYGYVDRSIAPFFLVDFCGIYFTLLLLLVVHFIYRYFVVCDFQKLNYFKGYRLAFWVSGCAISGFGSGFLKVFTFPENEQFSNELRDDFMEFYNLTMDQVVYNGPNFYVCDGLGVCEKPIAVWATTLYLTAALFVSVFIMLFCGYQSTQKLNVKTSSTSARTVELQKQLMKALIIQSAIPIVFMYIPIILLFVAPMFHWGFGPYVNFAMATLAIYPPIDQFAIIYVIRDFRNAIKDFFTCKKKTVSPQASAAFTTSRLSLKSNI
ncbi:Protein CBR-STR-88 [Caenorhabditis briggsae]|uniref:Serpentine receptor class r-10 n=2 Tax=Caenorhabditis briggsae TaxID=6238 RepID=A0AAE9D350_CAEBR|nr:Protein CBR-STR-88 [Caenorhabditis briggsae]ULT90588.1 hypothetical protein L3Y34_008715 [Caenorhabditis briggsae]CAP36443.2 Protein CBR-STR-88 [Caenorhabditis briggsae]